MSGFNVLELICSTLAGQKQFLVIRTREKFPGLPSDGYLAIARAQMSVSFLCIP